MSLLRQFALCFSLILLIMVGVLNSVRQQPPLEMIAFACCYDQYSSKLYRVSPNGENLKRINGAVPITQYLDWSPDGQWIAGISLPVDYDDSHLFYIRSNGHSFSKSKDMGGADYPSWSPDSQFIALIIQYPLRIVIKKWDTPDTMRWDAFGNEIYSPDITYWDSFTIDNISALHWLNKNEIIFLAIHQQGTWETHYQDGISQVYHLSVDDLVVTPISGRITRTPPNPQWSPDGQWLLFEEVSDEYNIQIAKMRLDGSDYQVLTRGNKNQFPTWSSDGQWIAFISDRENLGQPKLYKMRADGSNVQKLSDLTRVLYPAWSPKFDMPWHRNELARLGGLLLMAFAVLTRVKLRSEQV